MPRVRQNYCTFLFLYILLTMSTQAQLLGQDSLTNRLAFDQAVRQYHEYLTPEAGLYRGGEYARYAFTFKEGHPFFEQDHMRRGAVLYKGILYNDVPLIYDLVQESLVTNDVYNTYLIALINEELDSFTIENNIFIHLRDSRDPTQPRAGFYQQLYKGHTCLMKKERKTIREEISNTVERYIDYSVSYYLKKEDTWYPVNNRKSLFHALRDNGPELKKFMRKNKLRLREDKENVLLKVAAWYDSLHP